MDDVLLHRNKTLLKRFWHGLAVGTSDIDKDKEKYSKDWSWPKPKSMQWLAPAWQVTSDSISSGPSIHGGPMVTSKCHNAQC